MGRIKKNSQDYDVFNTGEVYPYYPHKPKNENLDWYNFFFSRWYYRLLNLTINLYEWVNLPLNIPERYIEEQLIRNGRVLCANSESQGMVFSQYTEHGLNLYHEALSYRIVTPAQVTVKPKTYYPTTAVPIYNNPTKTPLIHDIIMYADTLADICVSLKINVKQQRFPYIVRTTANQKLAVKNMFRQVELGEPVLYADKDKFDENINIAVLPTNVPYVADKLQIEKQNNIREFLTYLGINNKDMDKKERQTTDEINANNEEIDSYTDTRLAERRRACTLINELFQPEQEISVRRRIGDRERLDTIIQIYNTLDEGTQLPPNGGNIDG